MLEELAGGMKKSIHFISALMLFHTFLAVVTLTQNPKCGIT